MILELYDYKYAEKVYLKLNLVQSTKQESPPPPPGLNWSFRTETIVSTYKAIVRPILNIWFTQVSSSHLEKLEVIQNKALRIATG